MQNIGIIDPHANALKAMASFVARQPRYRVTLTASSGNEFLVALKSIDLQLRPSIIFTELEMVRTNGLEMTVWLKQNCPEIKIMVLTTDPGPATIFRMLKLGVSAYLHKTEDLSIILEALNCVSSSGSYYKNLFDATDLGSEVNYPTSCQLPAIGERVPLRMDPIEIKP